MGESITFKEAYCVSRRLERDEFERAFLREVLYPIGKPLSIPLLMLHPSFFRDELSLISKIGSASEFKDFVAHRNKLVDFTLYQIAPWRKVAGIRTSGRKLFKIGDKVDSKTFSNQ